jgi:hypothetical protein
MNIFVQSDLYLKKHRDSYKSINITPEVFSKLSEGDTSSILDYAMNFGETNVLYQLIITESGPKIRFRFQDGRLSPLVPITFEEINNEYIRLTDFFNDSSYIGRQAKIFTSYHDNNDFDDRLLLYKGESHIITYDFNKTEYLFNKKLPIQIYDVDQLKKIELDDSKMDFFDDPKYFYSELYKEILNETKENLKENDNGNENEGYKKS